MNWLHEWVLAPFVGFGFMRRALYGSFLLCLSACPVGVFLTLRRMSLVGDAMLLYGLDILPMTIGGLVAGLIVAIFAGAVSRLTVQKEDASMAAFYLISLAVGVLIVSLRGSSVDLMHVLFGTVLALNHEALLLIFSVALLTLLLVSIFWRALIAECLDPLFLRSVSRLGSPVHFIFLALVVLNLVAGFQALGTLLSVGVMVLPAVTARFWTRRVATMCIASVLIGMLACISGLLFSFHFSLPSGPSIILSVGIMYLVSAAAMMVKNIHLINVIASFSVIGDMAKNIGRDRIELRTIVGPNGDAHVYEPSPADAIAMSKADVILVNGLQLEGFISRLIEASETSAPVIETTKGANILQDPAGGHYHFYDGKAVFHAAPFDPHAWQSVGNSRIYVKNIAEAFCAQDKSNCDFYQANARAYDAKLADLENKIIKTVATIPQEKRTVVVGHNAFKYFEQAYGIHFLSPQGISTESEASAADVAGILKKIKENNASAVFSENISNPRLVEQIAREAGLNVAGVLYTDALSEPGGPASTYLEMMEHNVTAIATAASNSRNTQP